MVDEKTEPALIHTYAPWRTALNAKSVLRRSGMPSYIERSIFPGKPWEQTQGMTMLRSMLWVDDEDVPQERFRQFVMGNDEQSKAALLASLEDVYSSFFKDGRLVATTSNEIDTQFVQLGIKEDTARKCRAFFLNALSAAGYPLPSGLVPRQRRTNRARRNTTTSIKPRRLPATKKNSNGHKDASVLGTFTTENPKLETPVSDAHINNANKGDDESDADHEFLLSFLQRLPKDKRWTPQHRKRWLAAMEGAIDLIVEVIEEPNSVS